MKRLLFIFFTIFALMSTVPSATAFSISSICCCCASNDVADQFIDKMLEQGITEFDSEDALWQQLEIFYKDEISENGGYSQDEIQEIFEYLINSELIKGVTSVEIIEAERESVPKAKKNEDGKMEILYEDVEWPSSNKYAMRYCINK